VWIIEMVDHVNHVKPVRNQQRVITMCKVAAGAEPWSVYTRDELQILVAQNRIKPLTQAELRKVHEIKRTFGARITE
jgi:hypothetical protein